MSVRMGYFSRSASMRGVRHPLFWKNCPLRLWTGNNDETPSSLSSPEANSTAPGYLDLSGRPVSIGDSPTTLASTSKGVGLKHEKS